MAKRPATKKKAAARSARTAVRTKVRKPTSRASSKNSKATTASKKATSSKRAKGATTRAAKAPLPRTKTAKSAKRPVKNSRPAARAARARSYDDPTIPTPPSSLDMNRRGSAARTGRAEIAEHRAEHASLTPSIAAGDVDVNVENAYFSGDEAPGGDNPTPDQDIVDDIGKALGVEYQDDEELQSGDKVAQRDRHRWELDPASAEDYRERVQSEEKAKRGKRRS